MDGDRFSMFLRRRLAARRQEVQPMTRNEIARRLQQALTEYEGMRSHASRNPMVLDMAIHDFATRVGEIIMDIDADVDRERQRSDERERMTPVKPYWPEYPKVDPRWAPLSNSPHNSLDGE